MSNYNNNPILAQEEMSQDEINLRKARRAKVLNYLQESGIQYNMKEHPPIPTIEMALEYWGDMDATHCKNLFFRNHKGNKHYLVIFECHKQLAIHDLEHKLKQGKLSFASEQRMEKWLGVSPGSVSLFGLINDTEKHVKLFLDQDLVEASKLSFHPNENSASVVISKDDAMKIIAQWGGEYELLNLNAIE